MKRRTLLQIISRGASIPPSAAWALLAQAAEERRANDPLTPEAQPSDVIYELRVYHAYEGKLQDLLQRFREHTTKLFERHGM